MRNDGSILSPPQCECPAFLIQVESCCSRQPMRRSVPLPLPAMPCPGPINWPNRTHLYLKFLFGTRPAGSSRRERSKCSAPWHLRHRNCAQVAVIGWASLPASFVHPCRQLDQASFASWVSMSGPGQISKVMDVAASAAKGVSQFMNCGTIWVCLFPQSAADR